MVVYDSLLEAPSNLKESFDWIVAVRRCSGIPILAKALYLVLLRGAANLPDVKNMKGGNVSNVLSDDADYDDWDFDDGANKIIKGSHLPRRGGLTKPTSWVDNVMIKLNLMDEKETEVKMNELYRHLSKASIRIQLILLNLINDSTYVESYGRDVTWDNSCAENPWECADIFISLLIPLCDDLNFIQSECNKRSNLDSKLNGTGQRSVGKMFASVGFNLKDFIPKGTCRDFLKYYEPLKTQLEFLDGIVCKYTVET
ncbi:hypothetical protein, conserved [Babesia bigemina]|uniref:Uncharacterized protein n=1 Tax=Babesia bigemina TaxID=5866 RepID=A0A061D9A0_BABBI|nr:hypothetical protein, conserved [Babesia bigemina]CDR96562.1 hypothetical protein, conserved [Babesia bigemina]|eukprot:XP_012768748.1 hypothetical protein, conserved [Babesia bigemina]